MMFQMLLLSVDTHHAGMLEKSVRFPLWSCKIFNLLHVDTHSEYSVRRWTRNLVPRAMPVRGLGWHGLLAMASDFVACVAGGIRGHERMGIPPATQASDFAKVGTVCMWTGCYMHGKLYIYKYTFGEIKGI